MTSPIDRPSDEPKCARSSVSWRFSPSPICLHSTRGVRGRSRIQSVRVGHDAPLGRTFSLLPGNCTNVWVPALSALVSMGRHDDGSANKGALGSNGNCPPAVAAIFLATSPIGPE